MFLNLLLAPMLGVLISTASADEKRGPKPKSSAKSSQSRSSIAGHLFGSYHTQFEHDLQTNPETVYKVSQFSGFTTNPGVIYDMKFDSSWALRLGLNYRQLSLEGEATIEDTSVTSEFQLNQTYLGILAAFVNQPPQFKAFSLWIGFEYLKGMESELKVLSGTDVADDEVEAKSHLLIEGGFGYDIYSGGLWKIVPGMSVGAIVNSEPVTFLIEGGILFKYLL